MVSSKRYFYLGGLFSISLYIIILFSIFYHLYESKKLIKRYALEKKDSLEVTIVSKKEKKLEQVKKVLTKKQKEKKVEKKKVTKAKTEQDLKSLFSTIRTDKFKKASEEKRKTDLAQASRLKEKGVEKNSEKKKDNKSAQKLIDNLNLQDVVAQSNKSGGEYDKFWSKVTAIIYERWQETISTRDGLEAIVLIRITNMGRLNFKILKPSYNSLFNAKLKDFLDNLMNEKFPPYKKGRYIEQEFTFKDKK